MPPAKLATPLTGADTSRHPRIRLALRQGVAVFGAVALGVQCAACAPDPATEGRATELPPLPEPVTVAERAPGEARPARWVTLALVGEVRGEIEPCGCPTLPYGGFVRRERALNQLRAEPGVLIHLDAGETLVKGFATASRTDRGARATTVLDLSRDVGVDAWVPGPSDLIALGPAQLQAVSHPPAVSATWVGADGELLLEPWRVVQRDGVRLGVLGLSAAPTDKDLAPGLEVLDPVEAANLAMSRRPEDLDLVVALGNLSDEDADRVAREVPGLAAVLGTRGASSDTPRHPLLGGPPVLGMSELWGPDDAASRRGASRQHRCPPSTDGRRREGAAQSRCSRLLTTDH